MVKSLRELSSLENRRALITGGGGHLGGVAAEAILELGGSVILIDRDSGSLEMAKKRLAQVFPGQIEIVVVDLENVSERSDLKSLVNKEFGSLDILINNAAFVGDTKLTGWAVSFEEQDIDVWRRAIEVNLTASFHLAQLFSSDLKKSGHGSIVNIGSIYGVVGPDFRIYDDTQMGNPAAYAASKGGLIQLTRWLATTLAPDIRVNVISPGGIFRSQPEVFVSRYEAKTPLRRMAREDDFKGAIAYLASNLSAYVTGQNLIVDGGWSTW